MGIGFHAKGREFLSNFYPCQLKTSFGMFSSAEHLYQAMKFKLPEYRERIRLAPSPNDAKRRARSMRVRDDWDTVKVGIMTRIIALKFAPGTVLARLLVSTTEELVEENYWHDGIWGTCTCGTCKPGQNMLGKLLMQRRDQLRKEELT